MNKFEFASYSQASCTDPETRRVINGTWRMTNTLAANLIRDSKRSMANNVMQKSLRELPLKMSTIGDTLNRMVTVKNLYACSQPRQANEIAIRTMEFLDAELTYIAALSPEQQRGRTESISIGMYVLQSLKMLATENKQTELALKIGRNIDWLAERFGVAEV